MSKYIALFSILFTIISVNATTYNALKYKNPDELALRLEMIQNNMKNKKVNNFQENTNLLMAVACGKGIFTIINLILPGFLFLDNAFLMSGLHFALRGSTHLYFSIPITIANSVLVHQALEKMAELAPELNGEFLGEMGEGLMQEISWAPNPVQTGLIIGIPAMMEMLRGCRRVIQSGKEEKSTSPDCVTGCIQLAAGISNFFIPAYLPYALFSRLLALVYLQVDPEAAWMLFAANIYSIVNFQEANLNWDQMDISLGLFFGTISSLCIVGCIVMFLRPKH